MEKVQIEEIRFDLTWNIRHEVMYPDLPYDSLNWKMMKMASTLDSTSTIS